MQKKEKYYNDEAQVTKKKLSARQDEHSINLAHSVHVADMLLQYILVTKIVLHKITNTCKSGTTMSPRVKCPRYDTYEHKIST